MANLYKKNSYIFLGTGLLRDEKFLTKENIYKVIQDGLNICRLYLSDRTTSLSNINKLPVYNAGFEDKLVPLTNAGAEGTKTNFTNVVADYGTSKFPILNPLNVGVHFMNSGKSTSIEENVEEGETIDYIGGKSEVSDSKLKDKTISIEYDNIVPLMGKFTNEYSSDSTSGMSMTDLNKFTSQRPDILIVYTSNPLDTLSENEITYVEIFGKASPTSSAIGNIPEGSTEKINSTLTMKSSIYKRFNIDKQITFNKA